MEVSSKTNALSNMCVGCAAHERRIEQLENRLDELEARFLDIARTSNTTQVARDIVEVNNLGQNLMETESLPIATVPQINDFIDDMIGSVVLIDIDQPVSVALDANELLRQQHQVVNDASGMLPNLLHNNESQRPRSPSPALSSDDNLDKVPRNIICLDCSFECEVSYVESPSKFWIRSRPCTSDNIESELLNLLRRMHNTERLLQNPLLKQYCAAPFEELYRRARVMKFYNNDMSSQRFALVLYIDHGNVSWVSVETLCVLPDVMFTYQWQAISCRLYGAEPVDNNWSSDVVNKFKQFCEADDMYLIAKNSSLPLNQCYTVELFRKFVENEEEREETCIASMIDASPCVKSASHIPARRFSTNFDNQPLDLVMGDLNPWQLVVKHLLLAAPFDPEDQAETEAVYQVQPRCPQSATNLMYRSGQANPVITRCYSISHMDITPKLDENQFLHLKINRVESPDCIYCTPVSANLAQAGLEAREFNAFTQQLTQFYSEPINCLPLEHVNNDSAIYGAAKLNEDDGGNLYFRCRILSSEYARRQPADGPPSQKIATDIRQDLRLKLFYVDLGVEEVDKHASTVFHLDAKFSHYPKRVRRCALFDTRPISEGITTQFMQWPVEATNALKRMMRYDVPMKATVLLNEPDRVGVVLFGTDPTNNRAIIVNNELVKMRLARTDTVFVSYCESQVDILNHLAVRRSAASKGVFDDKAVRSYVGRSSVGAATCSNEQNENMPGYVAPSEEGSVVVVRTQCMLSCIRFSVTFPEGTVDSRQKKYNEALQRKSKLPVENFAQFESRLNQRFENNQLHRLTGSPQIGDFCLAKFSSDSKMYRAQIAQFNEDDAFYQIKYLDYGNIEWIHMDKMFQITSDDLSAVPFMSLECVLDKLTPTSATDQTENMNSLWEMISNKLQKVRVVQSVRRENEPPVLFVEMYVQEADNSFLNINQYVAGNQWARSS